MKKEMTDSEFYKWRCLVALVHADGKVSLEEINMIKLQFRKVDFLPVHLNQLNRDMAEAQDFMPLYERVTDQHDRDDLLQLAHTLFWSDSEFHEAEKKLYNYMKNNN